MSKNLKDGKPPRRPQSGSESHLLANPGHSFTHACTQQIDLGCMLRVRYCSKGWGSRHEQNTQSLPLWSLQCMVDVDNWVNTYLLNWIEIAYGQVMICAVQKNKAGPMAVKRKTSPKRGHWSRNTMTWREGRVNGEHSGPKEDHIWSPQDIHELGMSQAQQEGWKGWSVEKEGCRGTEAREEPEGPTSNEKGLGFILSEMGGHYQDFCKEMNLYLKRITLAAVQRFKFGMGGREQGKKPIEEVLWWSR